MPYVFSVTNIHALVLPFLHTYLIGLGNAYSVRPRSACSRTEWGTKSRRFDEGLDDIEEGLCDCEETVKNHFIGTNHRLNYILHGLVDVY